DEWWVVMAGELTWELTGGILVEARKDYMVWVPRGTVHHIKTVGTENSLRLAVAMPPATHYFSPCEQCGYDDDGPRQWNACASSRRSQHRARRHVREHEHAELHEQELVPRGARSRRVLGAELLREDPREGRLREAHRAYHEVLRDRAGRRGTMAVRQRGAEQVV